MNKPALLIDLDGTMYHGGHRISGADRLIEQLRELRIPYQFLTNNSSRTPEAVAEHLTRMGIDAQPDDVYTSGQAAARYITGLGAGKRVAMIGEHGLATALTESGLKLCDESPDYVVQGIDREWTYAKLLRTVRLIMNGVPYILTNPDLLVPSDDGMIPGAGTISASIQAATGVRPVIIGKPAATMVADAARKLGATLDQTIVIGDNMRTDIGAGHAAGVQTILVMTGVTTPDNYDSLRLELGYEPTRICADLHDLAEYISGAFGQ